LTMNCNFTITMPRGAGSSGAIPKKSAHSAPEGAVHDLKHGKEPHAGNACATPRPFP
jgi:hypothetical protein